MMMRFYGRYPEHIHFEADKNEVGQFFGFFARWGWCSVLVFRGAVSMDKIEETILSLSSNDGRRIYIYI